MCCASSAFNVTLTGFVSLIKLFLSYGFSYTLPGNFKINRLEVELGSFSHWSGECYNISLQQITTTLQLQRIKLYEKLNIELYVNHIQQFYFTIGLV